MATVVNDPKNCELLKIGGGGFITGIHIHPTSGEMLIKTDTFGGYDWNATTSLWEQLITTDRLPAADNTVENNAGVFEVVFAPSDPDYAVMAYYGRVYKSVDGRQTWTRTNFVAVATMEANGNSKTYAPRIAIDPLDKNVWYVGTQRDGLWQTLDGGDSFTLRTGVPVGSISGSHYPGISAIIVDPNSLTVSGRKSIVWAASHGNGYYRTEDGGATWATVSGGPPSSVLHCCFAADGQLYATGVATTTLYRFDGAWNTKAVSCITVACDPFDATRVLIGASGGGIKQSANRGATFGSALSPVTRNDSGTGDIPWLNYTTETFMSTGNLVFHPTIQNKVYFAEGIGVWYATITPASTAVAWISQTAGIEQLVPNHILAMPNNKLLLGCWDRPIWRITNPRAYPSSHYYPPLSATPAINHCSCLDYASSDPDFIVALIADQGRDNNHSVFSTDGGDTMQEFTVKPAGVADFIGGGCLAASTPQNIIVVPSGDGTPQYTLDQTATWNDISLPGKSSWTNMFNADYLNRKIVTADRVAPNTFYMYYPDGSVFRTTDGGQNWTERCTAGTLTAFQFHVQMSAVPENEGHLFFTYGHNSGLTPSGDFKRSTNGGTSWSTVTDVREVISFGFGAKFPGATYPTMFLIGYVNDGSGYSFGIFMSIDACAAFTRIATWPLNWLDLPILIDGDKTIPGRCYVGKSGSGFVWFDGAPLGCRRWIIRAGV